MNKFHGLILSIVFVFSASAQIPVAIENEENLQRGMAVIEKARKSVFVGIKYSKIKGFSYSLNGESIEEVTASYKSSDRSEKATRNFAVRDVITFEMPNKLKVSMSASIFDGVDTKIVHTSDSNGNSSNPRFNDPAEIKNVKFWQSLPGFSIFPNTYGRRSWTSVFPIVLHNLYGKSDKDTKYVYIGRAVSPAGEAEVVKVISSDSLQPTLYFDKKSHLLLKMTMELGGGNITQFLSKYKTIQGLRIPTSVNSKMTMASSLPVFGIEKKTITVREMRVEDFVVR